MRGRLQHSSGALLRLPRPLYQVKRSSDGGTVAVGVLPSGYADAPKQDRLCAHAKCAITVLFDQSPMHNDLTIAGPGANGNQNVGVVADALPVTVGGHRVYGMSFESGMGYRNNRTRGIATGALPESMYMVTSGTRFNNQCCFDFGNAETNSQDNGDGHMDAIFFGTECWFEWPTCYGRGPWVQADMENGIFMSDEGKSRDPGDTGNTTPFVTAMVKNDGTHRFAIKAANAHDGPLATHWDGPLPGKPTGQAIVNPRLSEYRPMRKEGAIILGTGGDDSNYAVGAFFEGVMTKGYATTGTDNAVQTSIVSAGYGSHALRCQPQTVTITLPRRARSYRVTVNGHQ